MERIEFIISYFDLAVMKNKASIHPLLKKEQQIYLLIK